MSDGLAGHDSGRRICLRSWPARDGSVCGKKALLEILVASGDSRNVLLSHGFGHGVRTLTIEELGDGDLEFGQG